MTLGPLEYLVVGFEGNRFTDQIMPELLAAREKGIIRVVDLYFLNRDASGNFTARALRDLSGEEAGQTALLAGDLLGLLSQEDIEQAGRAVPNNSSAVLLLYEHTWAIGLKEAIKRANGIALAGGMVAPDMLLMVEEELDASQQGGG